MKIGIRKQSMETQVTLPSHQLMENCILMTSIQIEDLGVRLSFNSSCCSSTLDEEELRNYS
jgi:hypothetical protein